MNEKERLALYGKLYFHEMEVITALASVREKNVLLRNAATKMEYVL